MDIPDVAIVIILQYLPICDLIVNVLKVNKKLNEIVNNTNSLFQEITFDFLLTFSSRDQLLQVFNHGHKFELHKIQHLTLTMHLICMKGYCAE